MAGSSEDGCECLVQGEDFGLKPSGRAGSIDFAGAVYQELSTAQVSPRVSD